MSLLTVVLLFGIGPPQQYQIQPLSPEQLIQGLMAYQGEKAERTARQRAQEVSGTSDVCFAIRSYIFKREDGNAPVLVGTTTCTPSIAFQQRRVGHPRGELVPLKLGGTDSR